MTKKTGVESFRDKDIRSKIPFKLLIFGAIFQSGLALVLVYLFEFNFISYVFLAVATLYVIQAFASFGWWLWFIFRERERDEEALINDSSQPSTSYNSVNPCEKE